MQNLIASSLKYENGTLSVLDQYLLPHQQVWHECHSVETMKELIISLKIRGAPLIGLGASHEINDNTQRYRTLNQIVQYVFPLDPS